MFVYTNATWGGALLTRKTTDGYCFLIGETAFTLKQKLRRVGEASSVEAEYIAQATAGKGALWTRGLCSELQMTVADAKPQLFADNQVLLLWQRIVVFLPGLSKL